MKSINLDGDKIIVAFPYDPALVSAARALPRRKFDPVRKCWMLPASLEGIEAAIKFADEHNFEIDDKIKSKASVLAVEHEDNVAASKAETANVDINFDGLGGTLRPFQEAGVAYALKKKRCFLADEMGLGKTVEALATVHVANAYPALVVCPASLKLNWEREAKKWLPGKTVSVLNGKNKPTDFEAEIIVINYDVLKKNLEMLQARKLQAVIFDESHYAKNFKAQRTEACKAVSKNVPIRLALTGTPLLNRPQELLSQLGILHRLDDMGGFWPFAKRYCRAYRSRWGWDMSGAAHLDELNDKLRATCYVRRNKADVLKELPPKQRAEFPIQISNRPEYQRAEQDLIGWLREQAGEDTTFLDSIKDLSEEDQKKAKLNRGEDAAQKARQAEQLVRIEALKQLAARGKLETVKEWVASFLETNEKLVLFAWHREIVEALAEALSCDSITGETSIEKRQAAVDRFQSDPNVRVIVCNVQAGGVGITLTAASNVAFVELGWTPAIHDQAEDRCHRIGQADQVTAWYLIAPDTIEDWIYELIESKRKVVASVTDGEAGAARIKSESILNNVIQRLIKK